MRLFLIGWWDGVVGDDLIAVAKGLQKKGHEIVYWSLHRFARIPVCQEQFPTTIFHDHVDALEGLPASVLAHTSFAPPGVDLIQQLYETESVVLTMMNKHYDWMGVSERKHRYYSMLSYWQGVLKKYQPEAIIFPAPPHTVYDYVIYALAKLRNITTIILDDTVVSDRLLIMRDFKEGSLALRHELEAAGSHSAHDNLSRDLNDYYKDQTNPEVDTTPLYTKKGLGEYSLKKVVFIKIKIILASLKNLSIFIKAGRFLYKKFQPTIKDEYVGVQSVPDWTSKFVYVPLQYQPECTTSTLGGIFADQILMIETLSAALPEGWKIYVKEHPGQWLPRGLNFFSSRYQGYYRVIAKIPHVQIVPITTNTYELLKKSQAVATATGTAGWEGLLRLKPALIFGYPWYQHCPGVFKIADTDSCRKVLQRISDGATLDEAGVVQYLRAFDRASFHGYVQAYGKEISSVSSEENIATILRVLSLELEQKLPVLQNNYENV